jgi:hypothetical protein
MCGRDGEGNAPALPGPAGLPRTNRDAARGRLRTRRYQAAPCDPGRMDVGLVCKQEAAVRVRLRLPLLPRIVGADLHEHRCGRGPEQVLSITGHPGWTGPTPRRVSVRSVHVVLRSRADVTAEAGRLRRAARPDSAGEPSALSDRDIHGGRDATAATDGMNWSSATLSAISRVRRLTSMTPSVPRAPAAAHGPASALRRAARARCLRRQLRLSAAAVVDAGRQPRRRVMDLLIAATPHAHGARPSSRKPADFAGLDEQLAVVKVRTISPPESDLDTAHGAGVTQVKMRASPQEGTFATAAASTPAPARADELSPPSSGSPPAVSNGLLISFQLGGEMGLSAEGYFRPGTSTGSAGRARQR